MPAPVAFVLKGYPRLSESFIAQEIRSLEARGLEIRIYSLRHPTDTRRHPVHDEIAAPVVYLPEYLYQEPRRVLAGWQKVRRLPGYRPTYATWLQDLARDPTPNRIRRFGQALVLAAELAPEVEHLHAHFLHTPASVTRYAALLSGRSWSLSAHAKDVWTTPDWEIAEKLAGCTWACTCSAAAHQHLARLAPDENAEGTVELIYHGLDLQRFPPSEPEASARDGSDAAAPVRLLSVGRAVAKKGYPDLLKALAALPAGLEWQLSHIGGGPELAALKTQAQSLGIAKRVDWQGAQAQAAVLEACRESDLFVLASRVTADGDRDGLPNVLMEAQSQGLACVASRVSGIPELIEDGQTGLLVAPEAPDELTAAISRLATDPAERQRLGLAGQQRLVERFAHDLWTDRLAGKFELPPSAKPAPAKQGIKA